MARAKRPLNQGASKAANDQLYANHEGDPRPNDLYDADGKRKSLDPNDPSQDGLRSEWMDLYEQNGGEVERESPSEDTGNAAARPPDGSVQPCPDDKWIKFRVVEDETDAPVQGVALDVNWPDGRSTKHETDSDGIVHIDPCEPGSYEATSSFDGMVLRDTLGFLGKGEAPAGGGSKKADDLSATRAMCIATIEERKVKDGDSIDSIAKASGLTWRELSQFNWGTKVPRKINRHLRDLVGCTKKTRDRKNYLFTGEDDPGIMYVPSSWSEKGLAVEKTHTFRCNRTELFPIILENERKIRLPEVKYEAKFSDGSKKSGKLSKSGIVVEKNPPPGPVEVTYSDLEDIEAKSLAGDARQAFVDRDTDVIYRVLQHSPETLKKIVAAYDAYLNDLNGRGLVEDIYQEFTNADQLLAVEGLLARGGLPTHGNVRYIQRPQEQSLAREVDILEEGQEWPEKGATVGDYWIVATPTLTTVTPGAKITYDCRSTAGPAYRDPNSPRDKYRWFLYNDIEKAKRLKKPHVVIVPGTKATVELSAKFYGKHTVTCCVTSPNGNKAFYEYPQWVAPEEAVLGAMFKRLKRQKQPHPFKALGVAYRTIRMLEGIAEAKDEQGNLLYPFDDPTVPLAPGSPHDMDSWTYLEYKLQNKPVKTRGELLEERHKFQVKTYKRYAGALNGLLSRLTGHPRDIHPIFAAHLATKEQKRTQVRVFVADMGMKNGQEHWRLVDWTNPADEKGRLHGEYDGYGNTPEEAIRDAIAKWATTWGLLNEGNRYWPGTMEYLVPEWVCGKKIGGKFETTGKKFWDHIKEYLSYAAIGLAIVGAVASMLAPVPGGRVASFALWSFVFSSLAAGTASAIAIAQRHDEHMNNWKADAMDGLTIASCVFGLGSIRYLRQATVAVKATTATTKARYMLIGSVTADSIQGILVAEEYSTRYDQILHSTTITPQERMEMLLRLFADAIRDAALFSVSMRATKVDLDNLSKGKIDPKKLNDLKKQNTDVDLPDPPQNKKTVKGDTGDGKHVTTSQDGAQRAKPPKVLRGFDDLPPAKDPIWAAKSKDDRWIKIVRRCPDENGGSGVHPEAKYADDGDYQLYFHAQNQDGYLRVEYVRTATEGTIGGKHWRAPEMRADELYKIFTDHFEAVAAKTKKPVKGLSGEFAFSNYKAIEAKVNPKGAKLTDLDKLDASLVDVEATRKLRKAIADPANASPEAKAILQEAQAAAKYSDDLTESAVILKQEALTHSRSWKHWQRWLDEKAYSVKPKKLIVMDPKADLSAGPGAVYYHLDVNGGGS